VKILLTGGNGFLAKEIYEDLKDKYEIVNVSRTSHKSVDLTNKEQVKLFFEENLYFDFVIHTAIKGGKRTDIDNYEVLLDNVLMFNNIIQNKDKFGKMFNFCSGAAFRGNGDTDKVKECEIINHWPKNFYGLSKNIISRRILELDYVYNFRIFGCFGVNEEESRFIKSCFRSIKNNKEILVHQNKEMDFFYSKDLIKVLEYYMNNSNKELPSDINLVYSDKKTLLDIAKTIKDLTKSDICCIVQDNSQGKPYTGSGDELQKLPLKLIGLKQGIKEYMYNVFGK
jgi:UDP-glucose 4-epimerase